ncbi:uncharacterized protein L201_000294 [Kwoniella dendrophila CBS 6074]|uniref:Hydrophobin n=1 Tax=Kwoniella dendrophila CBS 6074 TaxID=1295534 RepID=A0AAX4JKB3_9TREE
MCFRPSLADNSTSDVCCFGSYECAKEVCGSFGLLQDRQGINISVIQANDTTHYCHGYADLMNDSYRFIRNETCKNTEFQCTYRKSSAFYSSANQHLNQSFNPLMLLGFWVFALYFLFRSSLH